MLTDDDVARYWPLILGLVLAFVIAFHFAKEACEGDCSGICWNVNAGRTWDDPYLCK